MTLSREDTDALAIGREVMMHARMLLQPNFPAGCAAVPFEVLLPDGVRMIYALVVADLNMVNHLMRGTEAARRAIEEAQKRQQPPSSGT